MGPGMEHAILLRSVGPEVEQQMERVQLGLGFVAHVSYLLDIPTESSKKVSHCITSIILVTFGCGGATSENCSHFDVTDAAPGSCKMRVCKCSSNICQVKVHDEYICLLHQMVVTDKRVHTKYYFFYLKLRLDFTTFVITAPNSLSISVARTNNGVPINSNKNFNRVSARGQCLTDTFMVTNPGGQTPPTLCGDNTGQHS